MIPVHFASRAKLDDPSDGFDMVFSGIVVLDMDKINLYEKVDWDDKGNEAQPTFVAPYESIVSIKCKKIRSRHGNFDGGKITIVGLFDRPFSERITLKMDIPSYRTLLPALKESCRLDK